MGQQLEFDDVGRGRTKLTHSLKCTGEAYSEIGKLYEEQPKYDWEPLADKFYIYRGIISNFPDAINIHKLNKFSFTINNSEKVLINK